MTVHHIIVFNTIKQTLDELRKSGGTESSRVLFTTQWSCSHSESLRSENERESEKRISEKF